MTIEDVKNKHDFFEFLSDFVCDGDTLSVIDENIDTEDLYYELCNSCGDFLYGYSTSNGLVTTEEKRKEILKAINQIYL